MICYMRRMRLKCCPWNAPISKSFEMTLGVVDEFPNREITRFRQPALVAPPAGVCVQRASAERIVVKFHAAPWNNSTDGNINTAANNDQQNSETSANMVCICVPRNNGSIANNTPLPVFIPSSNTIAQWVGYRQRTPVAISQTELSRRAERDYTYEFAYKDIYTRLTTQNGLPIPREGLTLRP